MKKFIVAMIVACMSLVVLTSCTPANPSNSKAPDASKDYLAVCLASEPQTLDPALNSAVDGATMLAHLFAGLAKWDQDSTGKLVVVADAATELSAGVTNDDGTVTYTYTLKDAKWTNGQAVTAADYVYAWKRAASNKLGSDYQYMFEVVKGYGEDDVDDLAPLAVEAVDAKTLKVTLNNAISYWEELLAFPTYFPVYKDAVSNEAWATDPSTYVCNGPYKMTAWAHKSSITLEKNNDFYNADIILQKKIMFFLSDDHNNMLTNFKNGTWQLIDEVPTNEISNLKRDYPTEFVIAGQIGTYYTCWNINQEILPAGSTLTGVEAEKARQEIRKAIALLFDRNYIVDEITQAGQVPASSFVAMGMHNPDGTEFYKTSGQNVISSKDYDGYYNVAADAFAANTASAIATLKKYYTFDGDKMTNFPSMVYLYNTSDAHKAIGEYLQSALNTVGITMNMENQEWATFLETRKNGDYFIARNGWVADYSDPICFLDMWTTISGNNDVQFGKGANADLAMYNLDLTNYGGSKIENGTWAQTYDVLISKIKSETDTVKRYELMHMAEDMLMETGCIVPLYFYTDLYMLDDSVKGFYSNPLGYKYFYKTVVNG